MMEHKDFVCSLVLYYSGFLFFSKAALDDIASRAVKNKYLVPASLLMGGAWGCVGMISFMEHLLWAAASFFGFLLLKKLYEGVHGKFGLAYGDVKYSLLLGFGAYDNMAFLISPFFTFLFSLFYAKEHEGDKDRGVPLVAMMFASTIFGNLLSVAVEA